MAQSAPCPATVTVFSTDTQFDDPNSFAAAAALLFSRIDAADMAAQVATLAPGAARDASALFISDDSRWRLLRPLDAPANPDAFVIAPTQVQYLVRPPRDAVYEALVLVGLPGGEGAADLVTQPALAGRLGTAAGAAAGQIFTIEPTRPESCALDPSEVATQTQQWLEQHLN